MKATVLIPHEINVMTVRVEVLLDKETRIDPRYQDLPCRNGDWWLLDIDIDRAKVVLWPHGRSVDIEVTVNDNGFYYLYDDESKFVCSLKQEFVPSKLLPGSENRETLHLKIDSTGKILNWLEKPSLKDFPLGKPRRKTRKSWK